MTASWRTREPRPSPLQALIRVATLSSVLIFTGCTWLDPYRGKGFTGNDATWGEQFRARGTSGERWFFDERCNQIERSLGI